MGKLRTKLVDPVRILPTCVASCHRPLAQGPGASIPPTTMAPFTPILTSPPIFSATTPTHTNNFWTLCTQFCAILCVFSVNFGSCQSGIMIHKTKNIHGVGKTHCMLSFLSAGIKCNRASEKIFEKMVGRLKQIY